ncbi:MAG TPA: hypothetical protein VIV66_03380 [Pyrinomonadaceae bacterium]
MLKIATLTVLSLVISVGAVECDSNKRPPKSSIVGVYEYSGYDKGGNKIVSGQVEITSVESDRIKGTWQLKAAGTLKDIGPQTGTGNLVGEINEDGVRINLNPNMADNNVTLAGKITGKVFRGDWSFSGFAGVINRGTFTATRK